MNICLRPNWKYPVTEGLQFKTNVFRSRNGKEMRKAIRSQPRKTLTFSALSIGDNYIALDKMLFQRGKQTLTTGDFTSSSSSMLASASVGDSVIYVDMDSSWIVPGLQIQLLSADACEEMTVSAVATVSAFDAGFGIGFGASVRRLTLLVPLVLSWGIGTKIHKVLTGFLRPSQTVQLASDSVGRTTVNFDVAPGSPSMYRPASVSFGGRDAFIVSPDWRAPPTVTYVTPFETVDYSRGIATQYIEENFVTLTRQYQFTNRRSSEIDEIRNMFLRMKGRRGEFYMPTWLSDMQPYASISAGGTLFPVTDTGLKAAFLGSTVRSAIAIVLNDGAVILRDIVGIDNSADLLAPNGGAFGVSFNTGFETYDTTIPHTVLTLGSQLPNGIFIGDIKKVCWLDRVRFAGDSMMINWRTDDLAEIRLTVQTIEQLAGV